MNRLFGNLLALVCLLSVMCLSSCSYIEAENKVKNEINKVSPESTPDSNEVYEESQKAVEDKIEAEIKKSIEKFLKGDYVDVIAKIKNDEDI